LNSKDAHIQQQQSNKNHCSNKLFLAILLTILVLVLGAIAITLILALSRDKDKGDQKQQKMIINFGGKKATIFIFFTCKGLIKAKLLYIICHFLLKNRQYEPKNKIFK